MGHCARSVNQSDMNMLASAHRPSNASASCQARGRGRTRLKKSLVIIYLDLRRRRSRSVTCLVDRVTQRQRDTQASTPLNLGFAEQA